MRSVDEKNRSFTKLARMLYGSDKVDLNQLETAFWQGFGEGVERRAVKGMAVNVLKNIVNVPFSDTVIDILSDTDTQVIRSKSIGKQVINPIDAVVDEFERLGNTKMTRREALATLRDLLTPGEKRGLADLVASAARDPARYTDVTKRLQNKVELEMIKRMENAEDGWLILNKRFLNIFGSRYDAERSLKQLQRIRKDKSPLLDYFLDKLGYKGHFMSVEYRLHLQAKRESAKKTKALLGGKYRDPKNVIGKNMYRPPNPPKK